MTATATPPQDTKSSISPYVDRTAVANRKRRKTAVYGVAFAAALILIVAAILLTFGGLFTDYVPASAQLPANGNAISSNSPVIYRNVTVGKVVSLGKPGPHDTVIVSLHLKPSGVKALPHNVRGQVGPETVFGNESLVLTVPTSQRAQGHLASHQMIQPVPGSTSSFQTLIANLDNVLKSVHPSTLFTAFSALAQALQGQGPNFAATIRDSDQFLHSILPDFPVFENDLAELAPVLNTINAAMPDILGALSNGSTIAQNLTANQTNIDQFLATTNPLLANGNTFLTTNNTATSITHLLQDFSPLLLDINQSPTEVTDTLNGLDSWAKSWYGAEQQGPYLTSSVSVPIANITDLILAAVNAPGAPALAQQGLGGLLNPPNYTSKATYPSGPTAAASQVTGPPSNVTTMAMPSSPALNTADAQVYAGFNGGRPAADPQLASTLLNPVLAQSAQAGGA